MDEATLGTWTQQCETVSYGRNMVRYDVEGVKLTHYFPHLSSGKWLAPIAEELHKLLDGFSPNKPDNDKAVGKHDEWAKHLAADVPTGVIRLIYDVQQ